MTSQDSPSRPAMLLLYSTDENSPYPLGLVKMSSRLYEALSAPSFGFPLPRPPLLQHLSQPALNFREYTSVPSTRF